MSWRWSNSLGKLKGESLEGDILEERVYNCNYAQIIWWGTAYNPKNLKTNVRIHKGIVQGAGTMPVFKDTHFSFNKPRAKELKWKLENIFEVTDSEDIYIKIMR